MRVALELIAVVVTTVIASSAALSGDADDHVRTHTEIVRASSHTFEIDVGGTLDPENLEITLDNAGDVPVSNPRITVNGRYDWYTLKGLLAEILRDARTDEEKVMAIYRFVDQQSYWWIYPKDRTAFNPVRYFNVYGYHICSQAASIFATLCRAAGFEARIWDIVHHEVAEVKWGGAWHHIDADIGVWYLKDDNRTLASMADLEARPEWVARTYLPARWYLTLDSRKVYYEPDDIRLTDLYSAKNRKSVDTGLENWSRLSYNMDLTLRPGERIERWWKPRLHKYYDQARTPEPPRYANGRIVFEPDFSRYPLAGSVERYNIRFRSEDGKSPVVHVDRPQDKTHFRPSTLTIPMSSPYVIVGGSIDSKYYKGGILSLDRVALSADLDPGSHRTKELWEYFDWAYGMGECRADLDGKLTRNGPVATYGFKAVYTISSDRQHEQELPRYPLVYGGRSGLDSIRITADLQVNPDSLPALSRGRNVIRYEDATAEPHALKITYKWSERYDEAPPAAPAGVLTPEDRGVAPDLAPKLTWSPVPEAGGNKIVNYRVQVCLRSDCAWPVVSTLDRDVRSGSEFQVPRGWLNSGTVYYWRVRAEDDRGLFGPWSRIFSFTTPPR